MPDELYSARHGRARRIEQRDFADLVWGDVMKLYDAGLMAEALHSQQRPLRTARIEDPEAEFVRRLGKSDIYPQLVSEWRTGAPTSWRLHRGADVLWDSLEYLYSEI